MKNKPLKGKPIITAHHQVIVSLNVITIRNISVGNNNISYTTNIFLSSYIIICLFIHRVMTAHETCWLFLIISLRVLTQCLLVYLPMVRYNFMSYAFNVHSFCRVLILQLEYSSQCGIVGGNLIQKLLVILVLSKKWRQMMSISGSLRNAYDCCGR